MREDGGSGGWTWKGDYTVLRYRSCSFGQSWYTVSLAGSKHARAMRVMIMFSLDSIQPFRADRRPPDASMPWIRDAFSSLVRYASFRADLRVLRLGVRGPSE